LARLLEITSMLRVWACMPVAAVHKLLIIRPPSAR
jgi:hypothetical protein